MNSVDLKPPVPQPAAMLQSQPAASATVQSDDPTRPSFESLLRGTTGSRELDQARLGHKITPMDAARDQAARYDSQVVIGETAVAFQSRSIVAPASFNHRRADPPVTAAEGNVVAAHGPLAVSLETPSLPDAPRVGAFAIAYPSAGLAALRQGSPSPVAGVPSADFGGPGAPRPLLAQLAGLPAPAPSPATPSGTRSAAQRAAQSARQVPLHSLQFASPAFAHLVASESEYRIIIRGHNLSPNERERLIGDMNQMLGAMGLPFHPIHIVLPQRDA